MPKRFNNKTIPRPLNCFLLFRLEKQQEILSKCAGANHRDISKIIAKWWQEATEEEKRPYREKARLNKLEHQKLYPDYKYTPQKKTSPKRVYNRRNKKEPFTSRTEANNKIMQLIYDNPEALESIQASAELAGSIDQTKLENDYEPINFYEGIAYEDVKYFEHHQCQFASPFPELSYEADIASPFNSSTTSFDCDQSIHSGMLSPYHLLDFPYIDTTNACTVNNGYFDYNYLNMRLLQDTTYMNQLIYGNTIHNHEFINPNILHM